MKIVQKKISPNNIYSSFEMGTLKLDERLVFDIFIKKESDYVIIIEAGTLLSQNLYKKLQKQEQLYIKKMDIKKSELTCETLKYYIKHNKHAYKTTINFLYQINAKIFTDYLGSKENKIDLACVETLIKSIIFLIKENKQYLKKSIEYFSNIYELEIHSLHVSIYAINLGSYLNLNDERLLQLGIAGLLHDVGIKKIDDAIFTKETSLCKDETNQVQLHPKYSRDIAIENSISNPDTLLAILQHHENYDGSGYPKGLKEDEISNLASIISISEVFDALTSKRPYREKYSSFEALNIMLKEESMVNKFNKKFLQKFLYYFTS